MVTKMKLAMLPMSSPCCVRLELRLVLYFCLDKLQRQRQGDEQGSRLYKLPRFWEQKRKYRSPGDRYLGMVQGLPSSPEVGGIERRIRQGRERKPAAEWE